MKLVRLHERINHALTEIRTYRPNTAQTKVEITPTHTIKVSATLPIGETGAQEAAWLRESSEYTIDENRVTREIPTSFMEKRKLKLAIEKQKQLRETSLHHLQLQRCEKVGRRLFERKERNLDHLEYLSDITFHFNGDVTQTYKIPLQVYKEKFHELDQSQTELEEEHRATYPLTQVTSKANKKYVEVKLRTKLSKLKHDNAPNALDSRSLKQLLKTRLQLAKLKKEINPPGVKII